MPEYRVRNLAFRFDESPILRDVSFTIPDHSFVSIIGPNGVGKTTLIRLLARFITPSEGTIEIDGRPLSSLTLRELARIRAYVPQSEEVFKPVSVEQAVLLARLPYLTRWGYLPKSEREIMRRALQLTNLSEFARRPVTSLSGGERHRVSIARALAQQTPVILLDEPNAHLDLHHQIDVFELLRSFNRELGTTIVLVSHDLNLAARYSDTILLLNRGEIAAIGAPREVVTAEHIRAAFNVDVTVTTDERGVTPQLLLRAGNRTKRLDESDIRRTPPSSRRPSPTKKEKLGGKLITASIYAEIVTYVSMVFIRYANQGIPISEFRLTAGSNFFTAILSAFLLFALAFHLLTETRFELRFGKMMFALSVAGIGLLLWTAIPFTPIADAASLAFVFIKSAQGACTLLPWLLRRTQPLRRFFEVAAATAVQLILLTALVSLFLWSYSGIKDYPPEGIDAELFVFSPPVHDASALQSRLPREVETMLAASKLQRTVVYGDSVERWTSMPMLAAAGIDKNSVLAPSAIGKGSTMMRRIASTVSHQDSSVVLVLADEIAVKRIQIALSFHSIRAMLLSYRQERPWIDNFRYRFRETVRIMQLVFFGL